MQLRKSQLSEELMRLTQQLHDQWSASQAAILSLPTTFVSTGPEFCPLTCTVESSQDVQQLRDNMVRQIRQLSRQLVAAPMLTVNAFVNGSSGNASASTDAGAENGTSTALASGVDNAALLSQLQQSWQEATQEVTYLMVSAEALMLFSVIGSTALLSDFNDMWRGTDGTLSYIKRCLADHT